MTPRTMVTDAEAHNWREGNEAVRALLADRERMLGLLRESVDDQLLQEEVGNRDTRLRCDMCGVVLTYWRADGGTHEKPHNEGCLIPKWEAVLKEAGRGA